MSCLLAACTIALYYVSGSESTSVQTTTTFSNAYDIACRTESYTSTLGQNSTRLVACTSFFRSSGIGGEWAYHLLGGSGTLNLSDLGFFHFFRLNTSMPTSFTYYNVHFALFATSGTTSGSGNLACFPLPGSTHYALTFGDGTSENISSCVTNQPQTWELHLSHHAPQAGLLILTDGNLYFLVAG